VPGLAGCGATVVHDLVYNPAEGMYMLHIVLAAWLLVCFMSPMLKDDVSTVTVKAKVLIFQYSRM